MIGSGGDKAAREDMFPTQVSDWQTEARVGGSADRQGILVRREEPARRCPQPSSQRCAPRTRSSRPAQASCGGAAGAVLVVSRIDAATGREVVVGFNNGGDHRDGQGLRLRLRGRPGASSTARARRAGASRCASRRSRRSSPCRAATMPKAAPGKPSLTAKPDALTAIRRAHGEPSRASRSPSGSRPGRAGKSWQKRRRRRLRAHTAPSSTRFGSESASRSP